MALNKNIIFFTLILAICQLSAQRISDKDVPLVVKEALAKKFPGLKSLRWEKESINYEAEFTLQGHEMSANFDGSGNCLEIEEELTVNDLPAQAKLYLQKNQGGKKIKEVSKITESSGKITFEAEVQHKDFIFDSEGNFLSSEDTTE